MTIRTHLYVDEAGQAIIGHTVIVDKTAGDGILIDVESPTYGWQDMLGPIEVRGVGANDPAWTTFYSPISAYQFGANDECWITFHIPHDYVPGTELYLHTHWAHNSAAVTSGDVTWTFVCTYAKGHNQAAFTAPKTTTVTQAASTTQYQHMIAETVITTPGGSASLIDTDTIEVDGLLIVRISLTGNTMSAATAPFLFTSDVHYQSTGIGTKQKAPDFWT